MSAGVAAAPSLVEYRNDERSLAEAAEEEQGEEFEIAHEADFAAALGPDTSASEEQHEVREAAAKATSKNRRLKKRRPISRVTEKSRATIKGSRKWKKKPGRLAGNDCGRTGRLCCGS